MIRLPVSLAHPRRATAAHVHFVSLSRVPGQRLPPSISRQTQGSSSKGGAPSTADGHLIAFGCTEEDLRKKVFGLKLIGSPNEDAFNRLTGKGFVAACDGDYADAIAKRYKTHLLIVETTGAHNRALMELLRGLGAKAAEKGALDGTCYGEAHHSPRDFVTRITSLPSPPQCNSLTRSRSAMPPPLCNSLSPCRPASE